jgi:hypothetical protein
MSSYCNCKLRITPHPSTDVNSTQHLSMINFSFKQKVKQNKIHCCIGIKGSKAFMSHIIHQKTELKKHQKRHPKNCQAISKEEY